MNYASLFVAIEGIQRGEPCTEKRDALIAIGLRALLAAIGSRPYYRERYIAKGGTVLRLRSGEPLGRLSTDLDLSGIELGPITADDHRAFAADIGRTATQILRDCYTKGTADVVVSFDEQSIGRFDDTDPDTVTYQITVSAVLTKGKEPTKAKGDAFKIDLTCDEYVDLSLIEDLRITSYGIPIDVRTYAPLQSIAEKMRAILQKRRHFERTDKQHNWVPRHLLDLVPLRKLVTEEQLTLLPELFRRKCACRKVDIDAHTRAWLLDTRLHSIAAQQDQHRADAAMVIWRDLANRAELP